MDAKFCTHCGSPMNEGDPVCPSCGFNVTTGVSLPPESASPEPETAEGMPEMDAPAAANAGPAFKAAGSEFKTAGPEQKKAAPMRAVPVKTIDENKAFGLAVAGLVLGICGLVIPYVGFVTAIIGVVLSAKAHSTHSSVPRVRGFATAGLTTSIVGIVTSVMWCVLMTLMCLGVSNLLSTPVYYY